MKLTRYRFRFFVGLISIFFMLPALSVVVPTTPPPDPGLAGEATIEGIDTNANGVRDDLEIAIFDSYTDAATREILYNSALAYQALLKQNGIQSVVLDSLGTLTALSACLQAATGDPLSADHVLRPHVLNTYDRSIAYLTAMETINSVVEIPVKTVDCTRLDPNNPSVKITNPLRGNNVVVKPEGIMVMADVNGGESGIAAIQFKLNDVNFGPEQVFNPPRVGFSQPFYDSPTSVDTPTGRFLVTATVRNGNGLISTSLPHEITVTDDICKPNICTTYGHLAIIRAFCKSQSCTYAKIGSAFVPMLLGQRAWIHSVVNTAGTMHVPPGMYVFLSKHDGNYYTKAELIGMSTGNPGKYNMTFDVTWSPIGEAWKVRTDTVKHTVQVVE